MSKLPKGEELRDLAEKLGVDTTGEPRTQSTSGNAPVSDYELQRRVIEAKRSRREGWLWVVALISAIASMLSALAAWVAVTSN